MKYSRSDMDTTSVNSDRQGDSGASTRQSCVGSTGTGVSLEIDNLNSQHSGAFASSSATRNPGHSSHNMNDLSSVPPHVGNAIELRGSTGTSAVRTNINSPLQVSSSSQGDANSDRVINLATTDDKEEEDERADDEKLSESLTFNRDAQRQSRNRPGVILLGRGNSFSLGRSEVILLHGNRNKRVSSLRTNDSNNNTDSAKSSSSKTANDNRTNIDNDVIQPQHNSTVSQSSPAPPPISNGGSPQVVITNGVHNTKGDSFVADELELLWRKAESIMAAKQGVVQQVLEDFGIGEAGGGGGDEEDERVTEEENVWQVVQDNFQV